MLRKLAQGALQLNASALTAATSSSAAAGARRLYHERVRAWLRCRRGAWFGLTIDINVFILFLSFLEIYFDANMAAVFV